MVLSFIASTQTPPNQTHLNILVSTLYYDFKLRRPYNSIGKPAIVLNIKLIPLNNN